MRLVPGVNTVAGSGVGQGVVFPAVVPLSVSGLEARRSTSDLLTVHIPRERAMPTTRHRGRVQLGSAQLHNPMVLPAVGGLGSQLCRITAGAGLMDAAGFV